MNCDKGKIFPIGGGLDLNQLSHGDPHGQQALKYRGSDEVVVATKTETFMYRIVEVPIILLDEIEVTETENTTHHIEEVSILLSLSEFDCLYEGVHYFEGNEFDSLDDCNVYQCSHILVECTKTNCDASEKIMIGGRIQLP